MIALSVCAHTWTHDSDKAYFLVDFNWEGDTILVQSDLPWTIRQAMLNDLDEDSNFYINYYSKNQFEYDEIMYLYLRKNIFFITKKGDTLFLSSYRKGEKKEHSHGGEVDLIFTGKNKKAGIIQNTLFFNFDSTQVNYHEIHYGNSIEEFQTSLQNTKWQFQFKDHEHESDSESQSNKKDASEMAFWLMIGMIPILIALFLMFRKKL